MDKDGHQDAHHQACHRVGQDGIVLEDVPRYFTFGETQEDNQLLYTWVSRL